MKTSGERKIEKPEFDKLIIGTSQDETDIMNGDETLGLQIEYWSGGNMIAFKQLIDDDTTYYEALPRDNYFVASPATKDACIESITKRLSNKIFDNLINGNKFAIELSVTMKIVDEEPTP